MTQFKKGDKVRRTHADVPAWQGMFEGAEAEVLAVNSNGMVLNGWGDGHEPKCFELVASAPEPEFKIGDEVELIEDYYPFKTGTRGIVNYVKSDGLLTVRTSNGETLLAFSKRFKKVTKPEIKAGDTVTVEKSDWHGFGSDRKGFTLMGEVYEEDGNLWVGPISLGVSDVTVTAHTPAPEPAKPQLPTRRLTIVAPSNEFDRSRAVLLSDGKWYFGGNPSEFSETHPDLWSDGWRIVYDATEADA